MPQLKEGLWPADLTAKRPSPSEPSPRDILESQVDDLFKKTNGVLTGRVERGSEGDYIALDFFVVAPALEGYAYRLFKVLHNVVPSYPATVVLDANEQRKAATAKAFKALLATIFNLDATRLLITQLLDLIEDRESQATNRRRMKAFAHAVLEDFKRGRSKLVVGRMPDYGEHGEVISATAEKFTREWRPDPSKLIHRAQVQMRQWPSPIAALPPESVRGFVQLLAREEFQKALEGSGVPSRVAHRAKNHIQFTAEKPYFATS